MFSVFAVALGAALGALLRWLLAVGLNASTGSVPVGTLLANLSGAYLMGIAMAVFATFPDLAPEWRLLIMTGFLGGLTTFSAFSSEVILLLQQQRMASALLLIGLHVVGSLAMTGLGLLSVSLCRAV